jgi:hypothetical protein
MSNLKKGEHDMDLYFDEPKMTHFNFIEAYMVVFIPWFMSMRFRLLFLPPKVSDFLSSYSNVIW